MTDDGKVWVSEIGHMDEPLLEVIPPWPDDGYLRNPDGEIVGTIQKFTVSREEMHKIWPELDKS